MKKAYYVILTILTFVLLAVVTFNQVNNITGWVDLTAYQQIIDYVWRYGPIVLMCLFAFGNLFGRLITKILFIVLVLLLVLFSITMFAPDVLVNLFG